MASSSSSLLDAPRIKHDVFISFRGEDIRTSFLSHLRKELHHNHIDFFVDDEKLHPGDDISSTLIQAIEESSISLVIFSENYASSTWCLNELVKVIQCMKQDQRIVIPVFYNVVPSDVRHQNNSFKEAFDKHRHRLKGNMRKVQSWRFALMEASSLSGFHYPSKYQCLSDLVSSTHFVKATGWSSNHVCIWFGKVRSHHGLRAKNVTLKFSAVASDNYYDERWTVNEALQYKWEVIGCGVRPVYESDILDVFQNVDPEFQFFFDRRSLSQLRVDKFIFTLDEVKTRLIRKIEEERRRKEESWSEEVEEESSSKDVYN
ncbi:TMV resistance protein N [Arachis hypogaea]|nr:TMV resistance protein N [Arachis hypogaea]